jgi:hypothetical protein
MKPVLIILILFRVVFLQCSQPEKPVENIRSDSPELISPNPLFATWEYSFPFYSSELIIDSNGTFKFYNGSCLGKGYSEGTWIRIGQELVLTSYDRYKKPRTVPTSTVVYTPVQNKKAKTKQIKSSKDPFTFDMSEYSSEYSITTGYWPDTANLYFDHSRYRIGENVLVELDEEGRETKRVYNNGKITVNPGFIKPTLPEVLQPAILKDKP